MGETSFLWLRVAAGLYSLGLLEAIVTVLRRRESLFRVALAAFGLGALFQLVSIVEQGLVQHHFPANDFFESMSLGAWLVTIAFLGIYWRYKAESLSVFVFPLVFVMTLVAALRNPVSHWSSEAVRSTWLIVHIVLALLGLRRASVHGCRRRRVPHAGAAAQTETTALFLRLFPPLGTLDELISRSLGAGFVFITVGIIIAHRLGVHRTRHELDRQRADQFFVHHLGDLSRADFLSRERGLARPESRDTLHRGPVLFRHCMDCPCATGASPDPMKLLLTGLSHKTAPLHLREKLALPENALPEALHELQNLGASEAVILSTCNRVEIPLTTPDGAEPAPSWSVFCKAGRARPPLSKAIFIVWNRARRSSIFSALPRAWIPWWWASRKCSAS